jgi:hypothetical protein
MAPLKRPAAVGNPIPALEVDVIERSKAGAVCRLSEIDRPSLRGSTEATHPAVIESRIRETEVLTHREFLYIGVRLHAAALDKEHVKTGSRQLKGNGYTSWTGTDDTDVRRQLGTADYRSSVDGRVGLHLHSPPAVLLLGREPANATVACISCTVACGFAGPDITVNPSTVSE